MGPSRKALWHKATAESGGVDYEYSYNGATHTGSLNGEDEDGNPTSLTFTYNDSTDAITFVLPLYVDGDTNAVNIPVVYNRAE